MPQDIRPWCKGKVTPEVEERFQRNSSVCPFCGQHQLDADAPEVDDYSDDLFTITRCLDCHKVWKEIYKVGRIEELTEEEEDALYND